MLYRQITAAVMTGNNHKCAFAVIKKDRESTKVAGYVAQKRATVNAAAASSSRNGHRDARIKSYVRRKAHCSKKMLKRSALLSQSVLCALKCTAGTLTFKFLSSLFCLRLAVMNQPSSAAFDPSQKILAIDIQRLLNRKPFITFRQTSQSQTVNVWWTLKR